uniref:alpha-N-acetylgalactosaminide alpha-2,6-sialyltransferase n=1 Tax=Paramormyrops kingsleyae TaxID=1676925 RepID=A0A3B3TB04_9TELE|nr:alpha-N-acetylgalactosaminide alpha-2,6-sialyltransferase 2-like isoform X1 [Paramormyrops kingsleyae]
MLAYVRLSCGLKRHSTCDRWISAVGEHSCGHKADGERKLSLRVTKCEQTTCPYRTMKITTRWRVRHLLCVLLMFFFLGIFFLSTSPQLGVPSGIPHMSLDRIKIAFRTTEIPKILHASTAPAVVGPTDPPYIGDKYAQEDSFPQRVCQDSIRQKVAGTIFEPKILPRIPVLQWHKHFSPEEYRRLQNYPGSHGWGEVDYQILAASLTLLNTTANGLMFDDWESRANGSSCIRCAVVGNGGILRGSKMGREIDQHHYVFRTNAAVIRGFEEDVGLRTSIYTFSTNTMRNSILSTANHEGPPKSEETRYVFIPDHDQDYVLVKAAVKDTPVEKGRERGEMASKYFGPNVTARKLKMYHPDFIRYLRNRFLRSPILKTSYWNLFRPSTGAVMLLAALHTCDQVSAYGFMTPDYQKYSNHYYDRTFQTVQFFSNHDYRMELKLWQELHENKLIRLYMR